MASYAVEDRSVRALPQSEPELTEDYASHISKTMRLEVTHSDDETVEFDLSGVDVSFANALRRIMLAEVPTMAIETVYVEQNEGVVQDEVLAHRLGLVPIAADPRDFEELLDPEDATDANTIVFGLEVRAPPNTRPNPIPSARRVDRLPGTPLPHQDSDDEEEARKPGGHLHTTKVYSGDLKWLPQGEQEAFLAGRPVKPVHDDILLAKLRPGQSIVLEAHGRKGIGQDHAKFSPVSTAAYRMRAAVEVSDDDVPPYVPVKRPSIFDADAAPDSIARSRPHAAHACKVCEPLVSTPSSENFADKVRLTRRGDHFLFRVETAGQLAPLRIVRDAVAVLKAKCDHWRRELEVAGGGLSEAA